MFINLEDVTKRLKSLYNEISLSDEKYLEKKSKEFNLKLEYNEADAIRIGETKGTLKALLYLLES
jgi:hypothetical protein